MKLFRASTKVFNRAAVNGYWIQHPYVMAENISSALIKVEKSIHSSTKDDSNYVISIREVQGVLIK